MVYKLNDLKEAIRQEIRPIDRQLLARVMDDFSKKA
jgi:6-pyruvoyl-tetrahydropterin synthase